VDSDIWDGTSTYEFDVEVEAVQDGSGWGYQ